MSQEYERALWRAMQRGISSIDNVRAVPSADVLKELLCGVNAIQAGCMLSYPSDGLLPHTLPFMGDTE